jgi:putative transposase
VHAELRARGHQLGRKRVARLMRGAGVHGVSRRKQFVTTRRDETARPAPDLVERQFAAAGPNRLWVADITYITTAAGFLFLAVLDVWSRRVVGWAMAAHLRTELVMDALDMALRSRRPRRPVIHHSDHRTGATPSEEMASKRWKQYGERISRYRYVPKECRDELLRAFPNDPELREVLGE